jgi:hypothetical protein
VTPRLLTACAGFLLAVLWMDLMFDVQVLGSPAGAPLPPAVLASIGAYYRRVTTTAWPMSALIALVMVTGVAAALVNAVRGAGPAWRRVLALVLVAAPVALALGRVVPSAVRLGAATDPPLVRSELARAICFDHLACFASIAALLALQVGTRRP